MCKKEKTQQAISCYFVAVSGIGNFLEKIPVNLFYGGEERRWRNMVHLSKYSPSGFYANWLRADREPLV